MSSLDYLDLCRLCLVKDRVSVPIFEGEGDVRQIFLKITACLPVKVNREDKLPKKICDDCVYKVELCYQFWHTTANAEKQLLQWLGDVNMEDKQGYNVLNPNEIKPDQSNENRLDGTVMQQVSEHQNNMNMSMMDNMSLSMPMIMSSNTQQQITSVPMDNTGSSVQPVAGPSTQATHDQITQTQTDASTQHEEEEESSDEEENSDDECDGDEGLPIKEESEDDPNNRTIEPTTFVNVSLPCDEAGPSGLQQQKITDMPEIVIPQTTDVDPKTGTEKWISRISQKSVIERKDQSPAFVILQGIGDKTFAQTILVQELTAYHCDSCNEDFNTEANLIVHKTEQSILRTREALRQAEKKKHECGICGQTFSNNLQLINHRRILCRHSLDTQKKQDTVVKTVVETFKTETIKKTEKIKQTEKIKKVREKDKELSAGPVICDQCHKVFKKQKYLNVHKTLHGAPHICQICGAKLTSEYYLRIHIRRHNKQFTDFCEICNKGFYLKASLKYHMAMHTDKKSCICEICHKSFANPIYLRNHMKIHAETSKKFKCDICSFETIYSNYYKEHLGTHTGENNVTCEVCGKLIRRQYMKTHIRIHTGEKPEICEFCGKAFSARKYLIKHRRTHTGEKPYRCQICEKHFTQRGTLTAHLRRHENPK